MRHRFLTGMAGCLDDRGVATFRYQFPYMETGKRLPDTSAILEATVRGAVAAAIQTVPDLPLVIGGKSLGARMSSRTMAAGTPASGPDVQTLGRVRGLVFLGFPLHPSGKPSTGRADHLDRVHAPMLFLQGTRDTLADLSLIGDVCRRLGDRVTLHVIEGADHGFSVLKRSGRMDEAVWEEMADAIVAWGRRIGIASA